MCEPAQSARRHCRNGAVAPRTHGTAQHADEATIWSVVSSRLSDDFAVRSRAAGARATCPGRRAILYHVLGDPRACHGGVARLDADDEGELIIHGSSQRGSGAGPPSSARPAGGPGLPMETWRGTARPMRRVGRVAVKLPDSRWGVAGIRRRAVFCQVQSLCSPHLIAFNGCGRSVLPSVPRRHQDMKHER